MKYIRTKDGIYEKIMVVRQICDGKEVAVIKPDKVEFEPITKSADTIEELCDCIVRNQRIYQSLEDVFSNTATKFENIYGAIWTDKGLIYVAKLNNKGEFELL